MGTLRLELGFWACPDSAWNDSTEKGPKRTLGCACILSGAGAGIRQRVWSADQDATGMRPSVTQSSGVKRTHDWSASARSVAAEIERLTQALDA